jgi:(p)ppGpp synthase/HD superfamily hydrolase
MRDCAFMTRSPHAVLLQILISSSADADTLVAALAASIIKGPQGLYKLDVIEEQFGPIVRGIVEGRLLLESLPQPTRYSIPHYTPQYAQ